MLADDLGYSDLGCYGGEIPTPNIDALAKRGVRFTQVYNSARCCPSRAALMTGLYPTQAGIGDFTTAQPNPTRGPGYLGRLRENCVTMAEVLKPAGYLPVEKCHRGIFQPRQAQSVALRGSQNIDLRRYFGIASMRSRSPSRKSTDCYGCYYVGKWRLHNETGPILRGFDEFYGYTFDHSHDQYDANYYERLPAGHNKEIDPPQDDFYATDVFNGYSGKQNPAWDDLPQDRRDDLARRMAVFAAMAEPHLMFASTAK
uniref:sulfatase-like hydrolase/transferase n=1 Tax=Blastopirellula retiformator TaxID=2527970 RepID=UPI0036F1F24E